MSIELAVNGRFLCRPVTGVERVATELLRALRELPTEDNGGVECCVLTPNLAPLHVDENQVHRGILRGILWEHFELPFRAAGAWLLSPCNTGPLMHKKHIVIIHDAQPFVNPEAYSPAFRLWYRFLLPKLVRKAKLAITVSHHSKRELEKCGIVPPNKLHVIYNGADHIERIFPDESVIQRFDLDNKDYFLALGSLSPHKNLKMLIEAHEALPPGSPDLIIAGGGNPRVFRDAGIRFGSGVKLLGRISDQELLALYRKATAFLFPSLNEGFGIPPLEAMRCGCPVVATNAGAVPEVCGEAALFVSPYDSEHWTHSMHEVSTQPALRDRLRAAGYARSALFTWERSARELKDIMEQSQL